MRYITVYAKSEAMRKRMKLIQAIVPLLWVALLGIFLFARKVTGIHSDEEMITVVLGMFLGFGFTIFVLHFKFRQLLNTVFEMNEIGIQNLTPGKEKTLRWIELVKAEWIMVNRNQRGLLLKTNDDKMIIWQPLVPDVEDGTIIKNTLMGTQLIHADGSHEYLRTENSYAIRELQKHRPDLTDSLLNKPVLKFFRRLFATAPLK